MRKAAILFGLIFLIPGVLGFTGVAKPDAHGMPMLLNLFMVGTVHNLVHIVTGVIGLAAATSARYAKLYLQVGGVVYGLVALIGLVQGDTVLGLFAVNMADNILHVGLSAVMLALGFGLKTASNSIARQ